MLPGAIISLDEDPFAGLVAVVPSRCDGIRLRVREGGEVRSAGRQTARSCVRRSPSPRS